MPTPTRMSTAPARRMSAAGTRRTVGTTSVRPTRRPRLHHRLTHIQLRTGRSSPISIRVAPALRSCGTRRGAVPVTATLTAAPSTSFSRLAVRRRRERSEPAPISALRRAPLRFRARFRRTRGLAARAPVHIAILSRIRTRTRAGLCRYPSAAETRPTPASRPHRRHVILRHRLPQLRRLLVERFRPRRALRPVEALRSAVNA
jgi:hypothetical protein